MANTSAGYHETADQEQICYRTAADGPVLTGWARHDASVPGSGILFFDGAGNPVQTTGVDPVTGDPVFFEQVPCDSNDALAPQKFCFDTPVENAPIEHSDGVSFELTWIGQQGFPVNDLVIDGQYYPIAQGWEMTDSNGFSSGPNEVHLLLERLLPDYVTVQLGRRDIETQPGPEPAGPTVCDIDEGVEFFVNIGCMHPDDAPASIQLLNNCGRDRIRNNGFQWAVPSAGAPPLNANGSVAAFRGDSGSPGTNKVVCTYTAPHGWRHSSGEFEIWEEGSQIMDDREVTARPTPGNVLVLNRNGNEQVLSQRIVVDSTSTLKFSAFVGGNGQEDTVRVGIVSGHGAVTAATVGDQFDRTVEARNVTGVDEGGNAAEAFPWTQVQDSIPLAAGDYTVFFVGPDDHARGGLIETVRLYEDAFCEWDAVRSTGCVWTEEVPDSIDRVCEQWQPQLDAAGQVVSYRNVETGESRTVDQMFMAGWTFDAGADQWTHPTDTSSPLTDAEYRGRIAGCCDPLPEVEPNVYGTHVIPRGEDLDLSQVLACLFYDGEYRNGVAFARFSPGGYPVRTTFVGPNGQSVLPVSWTPGMCEEGCCPEVLGEGCWDDGTDTGTWVSIRAGDGTVTVTDPATGNTVDSDDIVNCPGSAYRTEVRTVGANDTFVIPGGGTNLVSWAVRARAGNPDLTVSGVTTNMDTGEVIESSTQDDTGILEDTPNVTTGAAGSARISWTIRTEP